MLNDSQILAVLKKAAEAKLPEWKLQYYKTIAKNIQVHTKGLLFSKVDTLFPNEHPSSKEHCVNTYEPITKGSVWKAINNIIRIFCNSSFTVSASDNTLIEINKNNYAAQNLFSFFIEKWNNTAIASDPNAICAVYPKEYIFDNGGDAIRFISSQHLRFTDDEMMVFVSEYDSEKKYDTTEEVVNRQVFYDDRIGSINSKTTVEKTYNKSIDVKIEKPVYHVFTKDYFLTFKKQETGNDFDYTFYYYKKQRSILPAFQLSGNVLQLDIKESFISPFIPFGNLALLQHRNHRAVDLIFSYPRMSEIETPCENAGCKEGKIKVADTEADCTKCGGTGWITPQSPYKVYKKKIDSGLTDPDLQKSILQSAPVEYHTPDTSILEYSKDSWKEYLRMGEEAVFIQQKQLTGNVESFDKARVDKEGEYSWIMNISKAINTDLKKVIQCQEEDLNANPVEVAIEQPISFALVTESEAFEALNGIINSDAPIFIKSQQVDNFINKFVSKSSPVVKALRILKIIDPLLYYSNKDLQSFKSNNAVSIDAWINHIYAYSVLMMAYEADKRLFENTDDKIIALVTEGIDKLKPKSATLKDAVMEKVA